MIVDETPRESVNFIGMKITADKANQPPVEKQEEWKDDITFLSTQFCTRVGQSTSVVRSDCDQSNMQMSESCYNAYDGESELAHTDPLECESAIADPAQNFSCCGTDWQEETSSSRRF